MKGNNIIGYCCGVWDLGHVAHIKFLQNAKKSVDILIVGIIEDDAVKKNKGAERPILTLKERTMWLASLQIANIILPQSTFDPSDNLNLLRPTIFIKGEDQNHINNAGANKLNIPIKYLKRTQGISTTEIINRIKRRKS